MLTNRWTTNYRVPVFPDNIYVILYGSEQADTEVDGVVDKEGDCKYIASDSQMIQKSYLCEHNNDTMQVWTEADNTDLKNDNSRHRKTHIPPQCRASSNILYKTLYTNCMYGFNVRYKNKTMVTFSTC